MCNGGGGPRVTITHDVLDLTIQGNLPPGPSDMGAHCTGTPPQPSFLPTSRHIQLRPHRLDMFKLFHFESPTVGKRAVHILLQCFYVYSIVKKQKFERTCL